MKKLLILITSLVMVFSITVTSYAAVPSSQEQLSEYIKQEKVIQSLEKKITQSEIDKYLSMTSEEITDRLIKINTTYDIGESFSTEDTNFIILYGNDGDLNSNLNSKATTRGWSTTCDTGWQYTEKEKYGTQIVLKSKGTVTVATVAGTNTFRGQATAYVYKGSADKIRLTTYHEGYGLLGSGGIGRVYSGNVSTGYRTSGWNMDMNKSYTGIICAYTSIYTAADVKTPSGTFTVSSPFTKMYW